MLWASGVAKTKAAAARMAGLRPTALYLPTMPSVGSDVAKDLGRRVAAQVQDETVEMATVLRNAGRAAVDKIVSTMNDSSSEGLQFKAAQDLADRSPETSKTQKVAVATFSLEGKDVAELSRALAEAAEVRRQHTRFAEGNHVMTAADDIDAMPAHAERIEKAEKRSA